MLNQRVILKYKSDIIGLLNREYEGEYLYDGISISALKDRDLSILRANNRYKACFA